MQEEEEEVEWLQAFGQRILKNALRGDPAVARSSFQEKRVGLLHYMIRMSFWLIG